VICGIVSKMKLITITRSEVTSEENDNLHLLVVVQSTDHGLEDNYGTDTNNNSRISYCLFIYSADFHVLPQLFALIRIT